MGPNLVGEQAWAEGLGLKGLGLGVLRKPLEVAVGPEG